MNEDRVREIIDKVLAADDNSTPQGFVDPDFRHKHRQMDEGFASWVGMGLMTVSGQTFDLNETREALRYWDIVGQRPKRVLRSIDDAWET